MECRLSSISVNSGRNLNFYNLQFIWMNFLNFLTAEHSPLAKQYYSRTNELCDKILKWTLIIEASCYVIPALTILVCGAIFYYVHDGHVEPQNLYMPLKTRY